MYIYILYYKIILLFHTLSLSLMDVNFLAVYFSSLRW